MNALQKAGISYPEYLASREWAVLKEKLRTRSKGFCERCAVGKYEQTHHVTYERIGEERLDDLLAVCRACHEYLSAKSGIDPSKRVCVISVAIPAGAGSIEDLLNLVGQCGGRAVGLSTQIEFAPELISKLPSWAGECDEMAKEAS